MLHTKIINSKKEKIEVKKAENFISSSKFGAPLIFKGTVRNTNDNKKVTGITYDSHDAMVIKSFEEIYNEVDQILKINEAPNLDEDINSSALLTAIFSFLRFIIFA